MPSCLPLALLLISLASPVARAFEPGPELRLYQAGAIIGVQAEISRREHAAWGLSAAYNVARRDDAGEHADERGEGPGLGLFVDHVMTGGHWFVGARAEWFELEIHWRDPGRRGSTDISVLQPTLVGGYRLPLAGGLQLRLTVQGGAEINVRSRGEDVGEGPIGLLGIALGF